MKMSGNIINTGGLISTQSKHKRKRSKKNRKNEIDTVNKDGTKKPKFVKFDSDDEFEPVPVNTHSLKERAVQLLSVRQSLPVYKNKTKVMEHLMKNKVTVLIGETGSGKSTQIPQFLMPFNKKSIAVTQPRRVAAINLANRVAEEFGTKLGDKVGYSVRFDNKSSSYTKLKYLTDGMLIRELMIDPNLKQYSTIIIDEAHERTVLTDMLMGFLKNLILKRQNEDNFKVIIMSATIDAEKFSKFFNNCEILYIEGKLFPVEKYYLTEKSDDILDTLINTLTQINQSEEDGDILAFLSGQEEIDKVNSTLEKLSPLLPKDTPIIVPLPLYAALPPSQQLKIFQPLRKNQRKIILATNIAETSITVPGVRYVVDTGLRKVKVWRHQLGLSTLLKVPISQASASQRSGRAGRERSGKTYRLYTEDDFKRLIKQTEPEIIRIDICQSILILKNLKIDDILNWYWIENPGKDSIINGLNQLYLLKALDDSGKITKLGKQMAILPVSPNLATVLIKSFENHCLSPVIDIISCLNVENLIFNPPIEKRDEVNERRLRLSNLGNKYGDLIFLKEIFDIFKTINTNDQKTWCKENFFNYKGFKNVLKIKGQLIQYMKSLFGDSLNDEIFEIDYFNEHAEKKILKNSSLNIEAILKSFLHGYIMNSAIGYPDRSYKTVFTGQLISVHPSSLLFGKKCEGIMFIEFIYTTKSYARNVTLIDPEWLKEIAPHVLGNRESINN